MMQNALFQTTPHHLSETHFVFSGDAFGLTEEGVRDLNLRFHHDGGLPLTYPPVNVNQGMARHWRDDAIAFNYGE